MESCELGRYRGTTRCEISFEAGEVHVGYVTGLCVSHTFQIARNVQSSISLHGRGNAEKRTLNSVEKISSSSTENDSIYTTKCI